MKRTTTLIIVVGSLAAFAALAWTWNSLATFEPTAETATAPTERVLAVPITTVDAENGHTARRFIGRVEAQRTVDIAFQVAGQIVELVPVEGDRFERGSLIAALDPTDYRLRLERAEATLALARSEEARLAELLERNVAPRAQLERVQTELRQAEVSVDEARRALNQTTIAAPFDAIVARRLAETFANVTTAEPVLRLQDVSTLLVAISLPEDLATLARTSSDAFIATARFPSLPDLALPLDLARFVTEADPIAQTYEVKFAIRAPDPRILPGMTATVEIRPHLSVDAVMVPVSAVDTSSDSQPRIWTVDAGHRTYPREISLGLPQGDRIPVLDGLMPGDRIVTAGWWQLTDGARVRPARF